MKKNNTNQLKSFIRAKGILLDSEGSKQFEKHDYFQVVNAYKGLFISGIENITTIFTNIDSYDSSKIKTYERIFHVKYNQKDPEKFKDKILDSIFLKYGINVNKGMPRQEKLKIVNKQINYKHHLYNNPDFTDFVRRYEFEAQLRSLLLRHVLYIENLIKKVFISTLNDTDYEPDFLNDISNYRSEISYHHDVLKCLQIILQMQDKTNSKPIKSKVDRSLPIPYWILINEMTLQQTIKTIDYLKEDLSTQIMINLFNERSCKTINSEAQKTEKGKQDCKNLLNTFKKVIQDLGEFRNTLAHNRPIYFYNIKTFYPNISFDYPKPKGLNQKECSGKNQDQMAAIRNEKCKAMIQTSFGKLEQIFGVKPFGANNQFDLSYLIYLIDMILKKIDPSQNFKDELQDLFKKFNIIMEYGKKDVVDVQLLQNLFVKIELLNKIHIDQIIDKAKNNKAYVRDLQNVRKNLRELLKTKNSIEESHKTSKYSRFGFSKQYTAYTGIDYNFLISL